MNKYKRGSAILVVVSVIAVLFILFATFLKSTSSRVYTTKKLGDAMLAREFANSISILANHFVKNVLLKPASNSEVREQLSLPYSKMKSTYRKSIKSDFESSIRSSVKSSSAGNDILSLLEEKSGLNELKWDLFIVIDKNDFEEIPINNNNVPHHREKIGSIKLCLEIKHRLPGQKDAINEDYTFFSKIKVVANLLPVVSKFTLYIDKAIEPGGDPNRFNVIDANKEGKLKDESVCPWVLNNGANSDQAKASYSELVDDSRGFVYLGGATKDNPINLGIARGWNYEGSGEFGEDFHFYKNNDTKAVSWKNYTIFDAAKQKWVMTNDMGFCSDNDEWNAMLGAGYRDVSKYSSLFRLYGTDNKKSPTLVLGYINSMYSAVRLFRNGNEAIPLSFIDKEDDFLSGLGYEVNGMMAFASKFELTALNNAYMAKNNNTEISFEVYKKYASQVKTQPYNMDYTYVLTGNSVDYPIIKNRVTDGSLKEICSLSGNLYNTVPNTDKSKYKTIYGSELKLEDFLDETKLSIGEDGKRIALHIIISDETDDLIKNSNYISPSNFKTDFIEFLRFKGLLKDKDLDLNGWIYLENRAGVDELPLDFIGLKVVSNGGVILSNGNILISSGIESTSGDFLTILALDGNIVIDTSVNTPINASLVSKKGQIKLIGGGSVSNMVTVNGNMVFNNISGDDIKTSDGVRRGLYLNYNNNLSAIPYNEDPNEKVRSEYPLLMLDLKDYTKMLD